jgi:flagellar assembly protein FliH
VSTVIKAGQTGRIELRLGAIDLADHLGEAQRVVEAARTEAARIVADALRQAGEDVAGAMERARREGYEKGHAEGAAAGRTEALANARQTFANQQAGLVAMFQSAVAEIEAGKERLELAAEKDLLDFAIALAARLTFAIGRLHRESARENLDRALALVAEKSDVTVRCHPDDLTSLSQFAGSVANPGGRRVQLAADESIKPGGCILRWGRAEVDASLDMQLTELVRSLVGATADG